MPTSIRHGANDLRIPHIFANTSCMLPSCQDYASAYRWVQLCNPDLAAATVVDIVADEAAEVVAIGFGLVAALAAIAVGVEIRIRILGRSAHLC